VLIGGSTPATFAWALGPAGYAVEAAVTVSFVAFVIARLLHTFNMRGPEQPASVLFTSTPVWAATAVSAALLLAGLYVPPLASVLEVVTPTAGMWALAAIGGGSVLVVGQVVLALARVRHRPARDG
jgi:magnesium-transporting ATPase (P-type)